MGVFLPIGYLIPVRVRGDDGAYANLGITSVWYIGNTIFSDEEKEFMGHTFDDNKEADTKYRVGWNSWSESTWGTRNFKGFFGFFPAFWSLLKGIWYSSIGAFMTQSRAQDFYKDLAEKRQENYCFEANPIVNPLSSSG